MPRLFPPPVIDALADQLDGSSARARVASAPVDLDPLALVRSGAATASWAGYFSSPGRDVGGLGVGWRASAAGPDRLTTLDQDIRSQDLSAPVLIGFSFAAAGPRLPEWEGFAPAAAVIPLVSVDRGPDETKVVVVVPAGREPRDILEMLLGLTMASPRRTFEAADHVVESRPAPDAWRRSVADLVGVIRAGAMEKAVLARSVTVRTDIAARPFDLVSLLRDGYPNSYTFGWQEGDSVFIGASPELLVARTGSHIMANPLAGSAARGSDDQHDAQLGHALTASHKDQREHTLVVEDMRSRLEPITAELTVPPRPVLRKFPTVQHLSTEVTGRLAAPRSVVELADLLHPTPAVGGTPRDESLLYLDKVEEIDRGWYAGGVGWCDTGGDGEVAVALRCGLLRGTTAYLFAGAGIVADSDPDEELFETRLKFRPMLDLLSAT